MTAEGNQNFPLRQVLILCGLMAALFMAFNNPLWLDRKGAMETLQIAGFQSVEILPYRFFYDCGRLGPSITPFKAEISPGRPVTGAVCHVPFGTHYIKIEGQP